MQKMPKQKIFRKKWMQKNAIKENQDFSLILAEYSLILLEKILQKKYFLQTMKQDIHCIQLPLKTPQRFNTKISGTCLVT